LLGQIKTFSKQYDQGQGAIFDVGECVAAIELLTRRQLENSGIALRTSGPGEAVFARGDPHLVEQIILNLVLNARDAIRDSGGERSDSFISVTWGARRGTVSIRVSDSGPGIPASTQARIFEPFFTTKNGGTGLGLSLSFAMARQMGGSLSLEPSARGAVFLLELPQTESHGEQDAAEPAEAGA
jgi:signal transduction histidine kinase